MTRATILVGLLGASAWASGCRFGEDDWVDPADTEFDGSIPWDASVDDGGVGSLCPEGTPNAFNNAYSPYIGGEDSVDLVVVDFSFFKCPHCADFATYWESVFADRPDIRSRVRFYFHHFPFEYEEAWEVHAAAVAAANQGMENFWALHDYIFSGISNDGVYYSNDAIEAYCQDVLLLDMEQFEADLAAPETMSFLSWDKAQGEAVGVGGTPSVFVCGQKVEGWSNLESVIDGYLNQ